MLRSVFGFVLRFASGSVRTFVPRDVLLGSVAPSCSFMFGLADVLVG